MLFDDIQQQAFPFLDTVPSGGMIYYLQFESVFRGRRHNSSFFCTFNGGEKSVFDFFRDMTQNIAWHMAGYQSYQCYQFGYWFVKLFPLPFVVMFIPTSLPGFWLEEGCDVKQQAYVSFHTQQTGYKRYGRKFLYGLPASFIEGDRLTIDGANHIYGQTAPWTTIWHPDYTAFPYTMGKMNRYIDRQYRSPLNPTNYWPFVEQFIGPRLVQHRHVAGRRPY